MSFVTVLGIDPGPTKCGFSVLTTPPRLRTRPVFVLGGVVESDTSSLVYLINRRARPAAPVRYVLALESIEGYAHEHVRSAALQATSRVCGLIEGLASGLGVEVVRMPAMKWRAHMCGKATASDALVKKAVTMLIDCLPKRTNVHVRDAAGVAFAVLQRLPVERKAGAA